MSRTVLHLAALAVLVAACGGEAEGADIATTSTARLPPETTVPPRAVTTTTAAPEPPPHPQPAAGQVDRWVPEVVGTIEHDATAFTQGFVLEGDVIYESTGLYGESTLRAVDRETGEVLRSVPLEADFFGEGLELVDGRLVQLTWLEQTAIVWDEATFAELGRLSYEGQGWGLCLMGDRLVLSDGTSSLRFFDPDSFEPLGEIAVSLEGRAVVDLNELECVDDLVFANVWRTTDIYVIDPATGEVTAVVDASSIDEVDDPGDRAVLNGIAFDEDAGVFLLTGKLWPTVYEVRFVAG